MAFWGNSLTKNSFQPKQKNRFIVSIGNGGYLLSLSSVDKPKVTIESKSFKMINHDYNYPGVPKWEPITMKFVDGQIWGAGEVRPGPSSLNGGSGKTKGDQRTTAGVLWEMLLSSGYIAPNSYAALKAGGLQAAVDQRGASSLLNGSGDGRLAPVTSPEKAAMLSNAFGEGGAGESIFKIKQLDPYGKTIEEWRLYNPIITEISWGDLDYGSDELVEYTLNVTYDWAILEVLEPGGDGTTPRVGPGSS